MLFLNIANFLWPMVTHRVNFTQQLIPMVACLPFLWKRWIVRTWNRLKNFIHKLIFIQLFRSATWFLPFRNTHNQKLILLLTAWVLPSLAKQFWVVNVLTLWKIWASLWPTWLTLTLALEALLMVWKVAVCMNKLGLRVIWSMECLAIQSIWWVFRHLINFLNQNNLFQKDVNSQNKRYEGKHSYSVYSYDDGIVGQNCCGHKCSEIRHANLTVTKRGYDHVSIMALTKELQFSLMKYKTSHGLWFLHCCFFNH